jgi:hypothetical protein
MLACAAALAATSIAPVEAGISTTVLDTVGIVPTTTEFSVFGSSGRPIHRFESVGPQFTISQTVLLTEIGGFVNNCRSIVLGVPDCPDTRPFAVEIRPSVDGGPDPASVIASFELSHDDAPLVTSYESVDPNLVLQPGTYFAMFTSQGDDAGYLLASAQVPFAYQAGATVMGHFDFGRVFVSPAEQGAVRILGELLGPGPDCVKPLDLVRGNQSLARCNLDGARITAAMALHDSDLREASMVGAVVGGRLALHCATLRGARLDGASITGDFALSCEAGADLTGLSLKGARITGREALAGTDLTAADLRTATITGAGALASSNLTGADLSGAKVLGVGALRNATYGNTTCPDRTNSDAHGDTCVGHGVP